MKRINREVNIFNLSMLDVMTGALGAVMIVMILLLTQKIGVESMTCQNVKSELMEASGQLSKTTEELAEAKKELIQYKIKHPETVDKISAITKIIDSASEKFSRTVLKISEIKKELFQTPEESDELIAFKIPHKIVMLIDLSGSMAAENNKY